MSDSTSLLDGGLYSVYAGYHSGLSKFLGVSRILLGLTLMVQWLILVVLYSVFKADSFYVSPEESWIRCATFLILGGTFGLIAGKRRDTIAICIHMVISLISLTMFGITKLFATGNDLSIIAAPGYSSEEAKAIIAVYVLSLVTTILGCIFDFISILISYKVLVKPQER